MLNKILIIVIINIALNLAHDAYSKEEIWYASDGSGEIEGELIESSGSHVTIDNKEFGRIIFRKCILTADDQKFIDSYIEAKSNVENANRTARLNASQHTIPRQGFIVTDFQGLDNRGAFGKVLNVHSRRIENKPTRYYIYLCNCATKAISGGYYLGGNLYWSGWIKDTEGSTYRKYCSTKSEAIKSWNEQLLMGNHQLPEKPTPNRLGPYDSVGLTNTGYGTGFAVTDKGHIITNAHVIDGSNAISVRIKNAIYAAQVLGKDTNNDIALLKVDRALKPLYINDTINQSVGSDVYVVGYPNIDLQGKNAKVTKGIINSKSGFRDDPTSYQVSVEIQPGNSGSPMLDGDYSVIGVITSSLNDIAALKLSGSLPQNVNFSLKSGYVHTFIKNYPNVYKAVKDVNKPLLKKSIEDIINNSVYIIETAKTKNTNFNNKNINDAINPSNEILADFVDHDISLPENILFSTREKLRGEFNRITEKKKQVKAKELARHQELALRGRNVKTNLTLAEVRNIMGRPPTVIYVSYLGGKLHEEYGDALHIQYYPLVNNMPANTKIESATPVYNRMHKTIGYIPSKAALEHSHWVVDSVKRN